MKRSLMLAAVSTLALTGTGGALAMDDADLATPGGNPAPAVDTPAIDKPILSVDARDATPPASMPDKPAPEPAHNDDQPDMADKPSLDR